jgi:hypothetical protein
MRLCEQLCGGIPEFSNLGDKCSLLRWVGDLCKIHCAFIGEVVEQVVRVHGSLASLLVPKNEVDPVVNVFGHVLALQSLSTLFDEIAFRARPGRQLHIVHFVAILPHAQIQTTDVAQEAALSLQPIKLGDQLLHIVLRIQTTGPRPCDGGEQTIGVVEPAVLQALHVCRALTH